MNVKNTEGLIKHARDLSNLTVSSIKGAMLILLNSMNYDKIKITTICEKAGVSRMAFYNNFKSIDDLITSLICDLNDEMTEKIGSLFRKTTTVLWYENVLKIIQGHEDLLKALLGADLFEKYLVLINSFALHRQNEFTEEEKFMRLAWAGAFINIVRNWVENDFSTPISELALYMSKTLIVKI